MTLQPSITGARVRVRPGPDQPEKNDGDPAPARTVDYMCRQGHQFGLRFFIDAEPPPEWTCRSCSEIAVPAATVTHEGDELHTEPAAHEPAHPGAWYTRYHRRQVFARRSDDELDALLAERLTALRADSADTA